MISSNEDETLLYMKLAVTSLDRSANVDLHFSAVIVLGSEIRFRRYRRR
jgi:hypothetical protein